MNSIRDKLFAPEDVLSQVRDDLAVRRKRRTWSRSKLTKYFSELIKLREAGASYAELAFWLRKEKRIKIHRSSIKRALDKYKLIANQQA